MRSSAANLPKLLVPALGMAFLWPYFRASFLSFLQVFAVHPSPAIHAAYTAYALAFMLLAVAAVPMARHLARWLDSRFAPVALGALGSLGNALLWVGGNAPVAAALCVAGSVAATAFFAGSVLRYGVRLAGWSSRSAAMKASEP